MRRVIGQNLTAYALALALIILVVAGVVARWRDPIMAAFETIREAPR